jgi:hypothetical protein
LTGLSGRLQQEKNLTADEQWILDWSVDPSLSSPISSGSFEILACHNILDICAYISEPTRRSSHVECSSSFTQQEILAAHDLVSKKLFNGDGMTLVSTFLRSSKSAVSNYLKMVPSQHNSSPQATSASLAKSAIHHKSMSEGAHVLYNLEITAALLIYLVDKVRASLFSPFYSSDFLKGAIRIPDSAELKAALQVDR